MGVAIEVRKYLGPGLLESVYQSCMYEEFRLMEIPTKSQMVVPIDYKGLMIDALLKCDFFVDELIVIELKSVNIILPVHEAQLITYIKLLSVPKGILINFNVTNIFKEGQKTFVNEYFRDLPES
ncbi:GxxExxY protein [Ferruginibacter sp.]|uniref:GxxExxY protein n=1 Tax=Ferruginibacter sp. TaxID=1940288 RepID=UPI00265AD90F|nr:GxxExxY protein [Ferruginibacter sp.]